MTPAELEERIEQGGAKVAELIRALVDPGQDEKRATSLVGFLMTQGTGLVNLGAEAKGQNPMAIASRVMVGAMDKLDDMYLPLHATGEDAAPVEAGE